MVILRRAQRIERQMMMTTADRPQPPLAAPTGSILSLAHQISYVTDDFDGFIARLQQRYRVGDFLVRHDHSRGTPGSSGAILHLALAWLDDVMIEVIQPNPSHPSIYRHALPPAGGVGRFHHLGVAMTTREQWDEGQAIIAREALPVEIAGKPSATMDFSYPDARRDFGHFLEFSYREGGRDAMAVPRNPGKGPAGWSLFSGAFQRGYVVADIDSAMARITAAYGITQWSIIDNRGTNRMTRRIALARTGLSMIELIEPNDAVAHIYADHRPAASQTAQFHHLGCLLPDIAALEDVVAQLQRCDIPIVGRGEAGPLHFLYADTRAELGHFMEYLATDGEPLAMLDNVPGNDWRG